MSFITSDNFLNSGMRGFNLSVVPDLASLKAKNIPAARLTGANHGRYWLQINHDPGSYTYYYCNYKGVKIADPLPTLDAALTIAEQNGFYIILTLEVLPKQGQDDWWGDTKRKAAIIKFWKDLAARYKDRAVIAAYDLMNEPRRNEALLKGKTKTYSDAEYMAFQSDIVNAVRSVDANHVIVIEVLENQMLSRVKPLLQKNLVYSPHGYSPLYITHQGISGTARAMYPDLTTKLSDGTMYTANYFSNVTYWRNPAEFGKKYNVPIWVGEFACVNWAPKNKEGQYTSVRWTKDVISYMESQGWSYAGHAWREWIGWDVEIDPAWYEGKTFVSAKPTSLPGTSAKTDNSPTLLVYKEAFKKNNKFYLP
jgi:hypothetical protein